MKFFFFYEIFDFLKFNFLNFIRYFFLYLKILLKFLLIFLPFLSFFFLEFNYNFFLENTTDKIEMGIFLKNSKNQNFPEEIENYKKQILNQNIIKTIIFVDREKSFNDFLEEYNFLKDEKYNKFINKNFVKSYFLIKFTDINSAKIKKLKIDLEKLNFVDEIIYKENLVKILERILFFAKILKKFIFLFLAIILLFIFCSNIKTIFTKRKNEFYILDILGIDQKILLKSIFFEAIFLGCISGIFSILIIKILYLFLLGYFKNLEFFNIFTQVFIIFFSIIFFIIQNFIAYLKGKNAKIFF